VTDISFATLAAARWLHFVATMLLFGGSLFPFYAWGGGTSAPPSVINAMRVVLRFAVCIAALSAFIWAGALLVNISGDVGSLIDSETLSAFLFQTGFGKVWALRLLLVVATLIVAFAAKHMLFSRNFPTAFVAFFAALLLVSQAWIGHAVAASGEAASIGVAGYGMHVLGAGAWLGGLMPLWLLLKDRGGRDAPGEANLRHALHRFSAVGVVAIAAILAGGLINVWGRWHSLDALLAGNWGRILAGKAFLFALLLGLAIQNRFFLMPQLGANSWTRARLTYNVGVEQVGALAILAASALLGITAPPA
jgi:putative copper resistance protein D